MCLFESIGRTHDFFILFCCLDNSCILYKIFLWKEIRNLIASINVYYGIWKILF